ncbi:cobalamin biosynthesis protein, partial [Mycobacterium tuberculosis]|nr:cobalamin biosynthesis protein [Mycobacterium tuberculosis]
MAVRQRLCQLSPCPFCPASHHAQPLVAGSKEGAMTLLAWCVAWILDVVIGDPPHWPHPVRWIGRLIAVSQRVVRRVCHS